MADLTLLAWAFPIAITLHNLEEAIWLPQWSKTAGRWHRPVEARPFRFAVIVLTGLAYLAAIMFVLGGVSSAGAYVLSGYALAMFINVFMPHLAATLVLRRYAPGTGTAVLFNLPVTLLLLRQMIKADGFDLKTFYLTAPFIIVAILALIPVLFAIGRRI